MYAEWYTPTSKDIEEAKVQAYAEKPYRDIAVAASKLEGMETAVAIALAGGKRAARAALQEYVLSNPEYEQSDLGVFTYQDAMNVYLRRSPGIDPDDKKKYGSVIKGPVGRLWKSIRRVKGVGDEESALEDGAVPFQAVVDECEEYESLREKWDLEGKASKPLRGFYNWVGDKAMSVLVEYVKEEKVRREQAQEQFVDYTHE